MPRMMPDDTKEYDELKDGEEETAWPHSGPGSPRTASRSEALPGMSLVRLLKNSRGPRLLL